MTNKALKHLNRSELLQLLVAQGEEIKKLREQLEEANKKLNERQLVMEKSGSIAEAALRLSGVFEAAEKAAQHYLENVKQKSTEEIEIECQSSELFEVSEPILQERHPAVPPCVKTDDMSGDEYWQQVKERAQKMLGTTI